jgi:hypothetical protein
MTPIQELKGQFAGQNTFSVEFAQQVDKARLAQIKHVRKVTKIGERQWQLATSLEHDIRADIFAFAVSNSLTLLELKKEEHSVEDVFQMLTK